MVTIFGVWIAIFLADQLTQNWLTIHLGLIPAKVLREPWRLLAAPFLFYKVSSVLYAAIGLWFFGGPVEQSIGRGRTLLTMGLSALITAIVVSAVALIAGAAPSTIVDASSWSSTALLGAWGIVFSSMVLPVALGGLERHYSMILMTIWVVIGVITHLEQHDWFGALGTFAAALCGLALCGQGGRLFPMLRGYREKSKTKKRRGFVVIEGGRNQKGNEPRFWN